MFLNHLPEDLSFLYQEIDALGFTGASYLKATTPLSYDKYVHWINNHNYGEMNYLKNHLSVKKDLTLLRPEAKSIFSFTHPYRVLNKKQQQLPIESLRIALYAQDSDYHDWLIEKLNQVINLLKSKFPHDFFLATTDSFPILERDFAYQNRLGWIGKNSCLIHPKMGSLFLIGNIISSLEIASLPLEPVHDFCGKCRKCIEACPTQAIREDRTLTASKCISYWTIEAKKNAPEELRSSFSDHFFGCDICQTVCPWNKKALTDVFSYNLKQAVDVDPKLIEELRFFLIASSMEIKKKLHHTALSRAKVSGLRRNAMLVIANKKITELRLEVESWTKSEELMEIATWTLAQLII
ncbi:MAG: tRNA epoxyqueuosine(34) reductase QueG [Bdellovibrionaceae bacterium]|nr:tRNA epoxyqueuosine(34) reductase QueG [Pseudobdellovibrionaceae bacterium]